MNSTQRKFLVDKITEKTKVRIRILNDSIPESISLNMHILHKVLSNDFEIRSNEELRELILKKALSTTSSKQVREDWLGNSWGVVSKSNVAFSLNEFFVVPEEYLQMVRDNEAAKQKVYAEISELQQKLDGLELRIMLASDKVLQTLVNEVDDMGDIRLIDTKVKLLG